MYRPFASRATLSFAPSFNSRSSHSFRDDPSTPSKCNNCSIIVSNQDDLATHDYIVHGLKPEKLQSNSSESGEDLSDSIDTSTPELGFSTSCTGTSDLNDSLVSKPELTSIRRFITRAERGIQVVTKSVLWKLVEDLNDNTDDDDEDGDEESTDTDGTDRSGEDEDDDETDDEGKGERPLGKPALAFLREMMNVIRAKEFRLTRNMYFNILNGLI